MDRQPQPQVPPLLSVALISAAALAYEILLIRLRSVIHWHHFAYMIISVALLGYGASGAFLALNQERFKGKFNALFVTNAVLFGVTSLSCFLLVQALPFNALEVLWDTRQLLWLLCIYLLLVVPFFCAANCICLTFSEFSEQLHRVYSFDLLGAGAGGLAVIVLLFVLQPMDALKVVAVLGLLAALAAMLQTGTGRSWMKLVLLLAMALVIGLDPGLKLSQFKGLSQAMRVVDAVVKDQRSSPLGLLTTVASPAVPFRHAPGMSLTTPTEPPEQLAVFTDGDGMNVITRFNGQLGSLAYLDHLTSALPYHLLKRPDVLVLGGGGGADSLQAIFHDASSIDVVELNPQMVDLVRRQFRSFSGSIYDHPRLNVHIAEARGFVAAGQDSWDLIQIALLDSFSASSAGLFALSENYLYTMEAFGAFLLKLRPGGLLAITRWIKLPPRDGLKMFATAVAALENAGISDPAKHLLMIRGWNTSTLLVSKQAFSIEQISLLRKFCQQRWYDPVYFPGMDEAEANRNNQLPRPWFFESAVSLLGEQHDAFLEDYKFNIKPATDDRPYFFHFLKWRSFPEILALRGQGGLPLLEQGYLILIATLAQAVLVSLLLVLLPLWKGVRVRQQANSGLWRVFAYFLSIGFAFMFVEIAFIQKFILFLSHPLYAVAVVLSAFLVFAGLGSAVSGRWGRKSPIVYVVGGIAVLALGYLYLLPTLFQQLISLPDIVKIGVSATLIAPLAFLMGMPFPLGLSRVARQFPSWVPWAWGINGCASVMAAVLATILAIHAGFIVVVLVSVLLYAMAAVSSPPQPA
jgi:hypothetical protein